MELETPEIEKEVKAKKNSDRFTKYDNPELYEFVVGERKKNLGWEEIALHTQKAGWDITRTGVQKVYDRAMVKSIMVERKGGEKFEEFGKELKRLYRRAIKILDNQLWKIEKVDELVDINQIEDPKVLIRYLKLAPVMNSTIQQVNSAIKVYEEQQDKITGELKAAIWDDGKLLDEMDKLMINMKKEGWVMIPPKEKGVK